jgi:hypothetical protein
MRFAGLTSVVGQSQSVTVGAHFRAGPQEGASSLPVSKWSRRFPWRAGLLFLALCGVLSIFSDADKPGPDAMPATSPVAAPLPAWIEIPSPEDVFRIEAPEFAGGAKLHVARQHRTGDGRQDVFEFGGANENVPLLSLLIYRPGTEVTPDSPFFVELARRAAESGRAIIHAGQPVEMATRFGAFEVARLGLARDGTAAKDCLGFRFANAEPGLRISGFACGGDGPDSPVITKPGLECLLDRIDLAPGAGDKGLVDFFAAHYAIRSPTCPEPGIDPLPPARISKTGGAVPIKAQRKSHPR